MDRKIAEVKLVGAAGHCDAPGCHKLALWKIRFDTNRMLYLCPSHRDEVENNYARKAQA